VAYCESIIAGISTGASRQPLQRYLGGGVLKAYASCGLWLWRTLPSLLALNGVSAWLKPASITGSIYRAENNIAAAARKAGINGLAAAIRRRAAATAGIGSAYNLAMLREAMKSNVALRCKRHVM